MSYRLTKAQKKAELLKCGKDPKYFITNFVRAPHPLLGLIPLALYDFQNDVVDDLTDHRFNIVLKSRQLGISTVTSAYVLWIMLFHEEKAIMTVATKLGVAANILRKVVKMYDSVPDFFKDEVVVKRNEHRFELGNGSFIYASATGPDAGRSEALSLLIIDEAAVVDGLDEMWESLGPTLTRGGSCIAIATPKGAQGWFYEKWVEAEEGANLFNPIKLPWYVHPEQTKEWYEHETKNMSSKQRAQEYECDFSLSGDTFIDPVYRERIEKKQVMTPKKKIGPGGNYWIWDEPEDGETYLISSDVARGDGGDNSTAVIVKLSNMVQVAEFTGQVAQEELPRLLFDIGVDYNNALLIVENNTFGWAVCKELEAMNYPNLYYQDRSTYQYVNPIKAKRSSSCIIGFSQKGEIIRNLSLGKLEEMVRNNHITIRSERVTKEMQAFIWKNGKAQAAKGRKDDLMMSLAMICWVKENGALTTSTLKNKKTAAMRAVLAVNRTFNTAIPGMVGYKARNSNRQHTEAQRIAAKYKWVLK